MEDERGESLRIGRVCREPHRHSSVSPNSSLRARGPNSDPHPPCILGEDRALLVSFPLRSPGTAAMKCRHPCLPLPWEQQGGKAEGWRGVHKPLLLQALPHFPDFTLATGPPILPAGSWALLAASVQLDFLPVCMWWVTAGGGPGCQRAQEKSGVSPTAGLGADLNQSPSTACRSPQHS